MHNSSLEPNNETGGGEGSEGKIKKGGNLPKGFDEDYSFTT